MSPRCDRTGGFKNDLRDLHPLWFFFQKNSNFNKNRL